MKAIAVATLSVLIALLMPVPSFADAVKSDWVGNWKMNHDGRVGVLRIAQRSVTCTTSPWCDMELSYVDSNGTAHTGSIQLINEMWQHLVFNINFPGNQQRFEIYLFSWDKLNAAGTTSWNGRIFGVSATKKRDPGQPANAVVSRTILADGVVEVRYADGTRKQMGRGGVTIIFPDGRQQRYLFLDAQAPEPPLLPTDNTVLAAWREHHNKSLLDIIRGLVANDPSAIDMLASNETGMTLYQQINFRTILIGRLLTQ